MNKGKQMKTLNFAIGLLLWTVSGAAIAAPCTGKQTPLCTVDHSTGATVTFPTGAVACTITDGAGWSTTVNGTAGQKLNFTVPTATLPSNLTRTAFATCVDAFGQQGATTEYAGTFPKPAAPGAPTVSNN